MDPVSTGALVKEFGLATGLLIALLCVLISFFVWVGIWVVKPLVGRHVKFLDDLTAALGIQSQSMQTMAVTSTKATECLEELVKGNASLHERIADNREILERKQQEGGPWLPSG